MKIIHTSDWHLGQIFNEYDRTPEHAAFFERLTSIIAKEKPDALIVSGDIYHNSTPSSSTQKLYTDAILEMKKACKEMTVIITAGNHDSPSRLEIDRNLWDYMGVKVIGSVSRREGMPDLEKHIIAIPSSDGGTAGYVIALPHIYRQNYPAVQEEDLSDRQEESRPDTDGGSGPVTHRQKAFYKSLLERVSERNPDNLPVVMMAHLAVSGCDISGHEEPIGGMEYTSLDTFPKGYDYLALGHIHHPQTLKNGSLSGKDGTYDSSVARYCGSPVAVSFDEDYTHSVSLVEISGPGRDGRKTVTVRPVEIPQGIPMKTIPENPVPFESALEALGDFPDETEAYIRLNVSIKDYLPQNASARAVEAARFKKCRYCCMKVTRETAFGSESRPLLSVEEIRTASPVDMAGLYYRQRFGTDLEPEMKSMLEEVAAEESKDREEKR